ncbi:YagK/YfjJ domain-containing protein [Vibrio sp. S12_S33]|uniref:YagK/YfjJ domain-containing protein n=1 Tax=Vibrio sp. S12_S33 TaxID=2720223 RepID=UPI001EE2C921|nr:inovirus-type Gp2 protein [Vibrio sp. S12_S33]
MKPTTVEDGQGSRIPYSPADDVYELLKGDERFPLQLNELFYRLSYFTKSNMRCFGCSHDSP